MDIVAITCDVEWAPDYALESVAAIFEKYDVKSTWFVTHDSDALKRLQHKTDFFEFGIHPNFLSGSTQGSTESEVLKYVTRIVPHARTVRTHSLFQSSRLMEKMVSEFGIEIDVSIYLPNNPHILPHSVRYDRSGKELVRVPYFWEDDLEWFNPVPSWVAQDKCGIPGVRIFNFHPMFVYANIESSERYSTLKKKGDYSKISRGELDKLTNTTELGPRDLLEELCRYIASVQKQSYTITDIVGAWRSA